MYTIKENLRPLATIYDDWLNGFYLSGLLQFKEQPEVGGDYVSKVWKSQQHEINAKYENAVFESQTPTYKGFIKDNLCRLFLLNGVERLVSACQAAPVLSSRLGRPNTTSFLFTEIMNDGAFRGTLRGLSVNLLQTSLVLWPSVYFTNKSKGGPYHFLAAYLALDTLLYPLDTIKNIMYAHTDVPKNLRQTLETTSFWQLYRGIAWRFLFNIPFAGALYTTATGCDTSWLFWLATFAAYPLNTAKVSSQVAGVNNLGYRGVVPFILVNYLCAWELNALATPARLEFLREEAGRKIKGE